MTYFVRTVMPSGTLARRATSYEKLEGRDGGRRHGNPARLTLSTRGLRIRRAKVADLSKIRQIGRFD